VPEPLSPTALELYLRCPFKYFSQYLLGLEEEEEVDETLTPLEHGRILHELLQEGFDEWDRGRERPRSIEPESYEEALALFRRLALSKIPPEHRGIEMERLFGGFGEPGAIPWLLRREMSRPRPSRRLVEQAFQSALRVEEGPRGERPWYVRIKGRVDRADVDEEGFLHVLDYKSGRAPVEAVTLQVPIYAMCLATELSTPVREATYLSFRDRKATSRADFERAKELLVRAFGGIQDGRFAPRPYQEHLCASCGFVGVCRKEIVEADEAEVRR
jgi:RecB family exonuclease